MGYGASMRINTYLTKFSHNTVTILGVVKENKAIIITIVGFVSGILTILSFITPIHLWVHKSVVMIDEADHHIGDKNMSSFAKYECEGTTYTNKFILTHIGNKMSISITAQDVDPNPEKSPIYINLNGHFVDYLNNYYKEEVIDFSTAEINVDNSLFIIGENNITIQSGEEKIPYEEEIPYENRTLTIRDYIPNFDDVGFRDLKVIVYDY